MPQREQRFFVAVNGMANVNVDDDIIRVILLTRSIQERGKIILHNFHPQTNPHSPHIPSILSNSSYPRGARFPIYIHRSSIGYVIYKEYPMYM
jgi:hypothetical protein